MSLLSLLGVLQRLQRMVLQLPRLLNYKISSKILEPNLYKMLPVTQTKKQVMVPPLPQYWPERLPKLVLIVSLTEPVLSKFAED